jgi:RNA polymerase sigma factor (sigma-70 family)
MVSSVPTPQDATPAYSPPPDTELEHLIAACAAKDSRALRRLYDLTSPQLLACMVRILKRRALAEEALQDVFVSIWQRASQYETRRGRARAWLVSIARHRAIDVLRQERAELYRETEIDELPQLAVEGSTGPRPAAPPPPWRAASNRSAAISAAASSWPTSTAIRIPTSRARSASHWGP